MKIFLIMCIVLPLALATLKAKRAAYELPAGYEDVLHEELKTTFKCSKDGYYADVDNNCQVFHVCHTVAKPGGRIQMLQWSFFCGNLTVFNQLTLTCTYPKDSIPCAISISYYGLNDKLYSPEIHTKPGGGPLFDGISPKFPDIPKIHRKGEVDVSPVFDSISPKIPDIPEHSKLPSRSNPPSDITDNNIDDPPQKTPVRPRASPSYSLNKIDKDGDSEKPTGSQPPKAFFVAARVEVGG